MLATTVEPRELTDACKITLPIAVMDVCNAMGRPMLKRRLMHGTLILKSSRVHFEDFIMLAHIEETYNAADEL